MAPEIAAWLSELGISLEAWLLAWARVAPLLLLVPTFGGSALPGAARAGLGLSLALAIAPAIQPTSASALPLALGLAREVAFGLPVAVGAALLVHTALMAGGAIDELRGSRETAALPMFDGGTTPLGALLGLLVIIAFHQSGGAARLVALLAVSRPESVGLVAITSNIVTSVGFAVAAAAPITVAAIVLSVAEALFARAATPAHVAGLLAPLRGIALLAIVALVLDRIVEFLVLPR